MRVTRPMLAARLKNLADLAYPVLATPKLDGIRCLKVDGVAVSRAFKPIRNRHIASLVETLPDGVDGELIVPDGTFQDSQSSIMSADGKPNFEYWIFDVAGYVPYKERVLHIPTAPFVRPCLPTLVESESALLDFEENCLNAGYEGIIVRSPYGPYKCGRSTAREGYMFKYKRFTDSEAVILELIEARENQNPIQLNAFGLARRPGGASGKVPKGTLGTMRVRDVHTNVEFEVGTGIGLTAALRQQMWDNPLAYIGRIINYRFQGCGVKDKPRFPSFQGFRDEM